MAFRRARARVFLSCLCFEPELTHFVPSMDTSEIGSISTPGGSLHSFSLASHHVTLCLIPVQIYMHPWKVTPHAECVIAITVTRGTQPGRRKFKVAGVIVSEAGSDGIQNAGVMGGGALIAGDN